MPDADTNLNAEISADEPYVADNDRPLDPGLYLVGTPIGNLEDITLRALRVLRQADRIACEDTRQTQKLLNRFGIKTPTLSLHMHNEHNRSAELVADLQAGKRIAVVSDAGMPGISDPGGSLTQAAIAAGMPVYPIPGANAAVSALVASGLSTTNFQFLGFLPEKAGARRTALESLSAEAARQPRTFIFYEAPHRILETLSDLESVWGPDLPTVVARELTKLHEEFLRGTVQEIRTNLAQRDRVRGEITLLIEPAAIKPGNPDESKPAQSLGARIEQLIQSGLSEKEALKQLARESNQSKSDLYRELQRTRAKAQGSNRR
jgi:16S rRNA (cytidine1402-2'-O)-methyltransferase